MQNATDESSAVSVDQLLAKTKEAKQAQLQEGEEMPYDLADKDEFLTSLQRARGIHIVGDSVYVAPRSSSKGRGGFSRGGEADENDATAGNGEAGEQRRRRSARGARGKDQPVAAGDQGAASGEDQALDGAMQQRRRRTRPQGTPQEPRSVTLSADVNDSTFIAHLIYKCDNRIVGKLSC